MWHLMRYYAHFGIKDFILCLGYRGDLIKNYFLNYHEWLSNDFVMRRGGREIETFHNDIEDWTITFVDTGLNSNIGQRLMAVRHLLQDEDVFMANYTDGLADLDLNRYMDFFLRHDKVGCFLSVRPSQSFHIVDIENQGVVKTIQPVGDSPIWINGGFFIFKRQIFDYIQEGEELVQQPFYRLIDCQQLVSYRNQGFWACMDTLKEKKMFDDMYASGNRPWAVWENTPDLEPEVRPLVTPMISQSLPMLDK